MYLDSQRKSLLTEIHARISDVVTKRYVGNERCRRLSAPRGSGKSKFLKELVRTIPKFLRSIVLYVDSRESKCSLLNILLHVLSKNNIQGVVPSWGGVRVALQAQKVCLVVFYDEVEDTIDNRNASARAFYGDSFRDLHALGNDDIGDWWCLLTGSATTLSGKLRELNGRKFGGLKYGPPEADEQDLLEVHFKVPQGLRGCSFWLAGGLAANLQKMQSTNWEMGGVQFDLLDELPAGQRVRAIRATQILCQELTQRIALNGRKEALGEIGQAVDLALVEQALAQEPRIWRSVCIPSIEVARLLEKHNLDEQDALNALQDTRVLTRSHSSLGWELRVGVPFICAYVASRTPRNFFSDMIDQAKLRKVLPAGLAVLAREEVRRAVDYLHSFDISTFLQ